MIKISNSNFSMTGTELLKKEHTELNQMQRLLSSLTESNHMLFMMMNSHCGDGDSQQSEQWNAVMFPRYRTLAGFFDVSVKEIIHNLVLEFCKTHPDMDFNRLRMNYCLERHKSYCYTLDVIASEPELRRQFEHMVDRLMDKYNLVCAGDTSRIHTIFDDREVREYEPR